MRRPSLVLAGLAVVAVVIYLAGRFLLASPGIEPTPSTLQTDMLRDERVRCRGRVIPARWQSLSFARAGRIAGVAAREGAAVRQGDVLAELEPEDLSPELQAADQALRLAQTRLAQAQATPTLYDLRAAEAQVRAARARMEALRAGPTEGDLRRARIGLQQARNSLWSAQQGRDAIGGMCTDCASYHQAQAAVASAELGVQLAEMDYEAAQAAPDPEALATAETQLAQAEGRLAALQAGPSPQDLAALQIAVEQAQTSLDRLQRQGREAEAARRLLAPFDGVVIALSIVEGQTVSPGAEALVVADLATMQVETVDLGDLDIAAVEIDQPVEIAVPGLQNRILRGHVVYISPRASGPAGDQAFFRVVVALNRQEPALRWGMGADLAFGRGRR